MLIVVARHGDQFRPIWEKAAKDCKYPILFVGDDDSDGYDTGKYIWTLQNYVYPRYLFIQDSVVPHPGDWASPFDNPEHEVIAWSGFPFPMWDDTSQEQAARERYGDVQPRLGIFGPIFAATHRAMRQIILPSFPTTKLAQQGKEREWAMAFEKAGIPVHHLVEHHDPQAMLKGEYPCFTKLFPCRP